MCFHSVTGRTSSALLVAMTSLLCGAAGCQSGATNAPDAESEAYARDLVGGEEASPGHLPSTVYLSGVCTAAKVGPRALLVAAHCVLDGAGSLRPEFQPDAQLSVSTLLRYESTGPRAVGDVTDTVFLVERTLAFDAYARAKRESGCRAT